MPDQDRVVAPGNSTGTVRTADGRLLAVPSGWQLLPPGDGPLTKLVKSKGPCWLVQVKVKNRLVSKGVWASADHIAAATAELAAMRAAPGYAEQRRRQLARRERQQQEYFEEFYQAVLDFLQFHPRHATLAGRLARAVTDLATPVGSGTVARTERIPLPQRARAAVIAWLRHQTTDYDRMTIARVKGQRRRVRQELAGRSLNLLQRYREGGDIPPSCPLQKVLGDGQRGATGAAHPAAARVTEP